MLADATLNWEKAILKQNNRDIYRADIVKLGHHGHDSTSSELLTTIAPQAAIITTGKSHIGSTANFGYPQLQVIDRLNDYFNRNTEINHNSKNDRFPLC